MRWFRSSFAPSWAELRDGESVVQEVEILFPLKTLPALSFLSADEARKWLRDTERKMAKNQAFRYLARQSLASSVLLQKLAIKGYSKEICREIIEDLRSGGYLADEEIWPRIIERELAKGYGPRWIEWKWKAKGLPSNLVDLIATVEKQRKAIRKLKTKFPSKEKAVQALLRRGFDFRLITQEIEIF